MKRNKDYFYRVLWTLLIFSLMVGCTVKTTGDPTATSSVPTLPPAQPTIVMVDGTPQLIYEEQFATPTANLQDAQPVQLTELRFFQDGQRINLYTKMRSIVADAIAKDVVFEITARDITGNRLFQETTLVKYIFPQEVTGLAYQFELMPGFIVHNIELRVVSGVLDRNLKYSQPLTVRMPSLQKTENSGNFTAWLKNEDPYTYTQVRLNAIAYNKNNEIIGGGTSIVDFVPHQDEIGVAVPVQSLSERDVDRVEFYPWITQYSASLEDGKWWDTIEVQDWNFEVNEYMRFGGGAVLKNLSKQLVTDTFYIVTLSDEFGRVVLSDTGYVDYIWPEEEISFAIASQDLPFTEEFPDESTTPTPEATPQPKETNESPEEETEPETTPEPSATPKARGIGVLARPVNKNAASNHLQDTYPIEDTPTNPVEPTVRITYTPTPEPTKEEPTPEPTTEKTPVEPTVTPTPTLDPNLPEALRVYPEHFTVDLIIVPGEFGSSQLGYNPLNASQAAFADENNVRVSVVNNLNMDLEHAIIYVLIVDENGQIVGGGRQLSQTIRSSSATEVLVPVAYQGERENLQVKAFATLTKKALNIP